MAWARPSELHRALECPASTVLPKTEDTTGPAAEWGKELHTWKETGKSTPRVHKWLAEITADPESLRAELWPGGQHEVAYKMGEHGTFFGTWLPDETARRAWMREGRPVIRGIADWVGYDVVPHVNDLKTGRFAPEPEAPQLLWYGDAVLDFFPRELGVNLSVYHWPRYPKGRLPTKQTVFMPSDDIKSWHRHRLMPAIEESKKPMAKYDSRPGPWCQFCRSAPWCAAQGGTQP